MRPAAKTTESMDGQPALWRRICVSMLTMVVLPIALLMTFAVGAGYFRLTQGPVSVNFLVQPIKQGIDQGLPGLSARFDDVIVTLAEAGGLELRLANLSLSDVSGNVVVTAPQAAIGLSASGLWSLSAMPERVELIEPRISLLYSRTSGFALSFAKDAADTGQEQARSTLGVARKPSDGEIYDLSAILRSASTYARGGGYQSSGLREVGLRNATLLLDAEGRKTSWQIPRLLVDVDHRSDRSVISGSARVSSAGRIWSASFQADDDANGDLLTVSTSIQDLVPKNIADAVPGLSLLALFDQPASANIEAKFDRSGQLKDSKIAVELSGTHLQLQDMPKPLFEVEKGSLNFAYAPSSRKIVLEPSTLRGGRNAFVVSGELSQSNDAPAEGATGWQFDMQLQPAPQTADVSNDVSVQSGSLKGRFVPQDEMVHVDTVEIGLAGGNIQLAGEFSVGHEHSAKWQGNFSGMPVAQLAAVWPEAVAEAGRQWLIHNVHAGRVETGTFSYLSGRHLAAVQSVSAVGASQMVMAMEVGGVEFSALNGLPPVRADKVLARFANDKLEVSFPEGAMNVETGGTIALKTFQFVGSEMFGEAPSGEASFDFAGKAEAVRSVLELPALASAVAANGPMPAIEGSIDGTAKIGFPLDKVVGAADVGYEIKARLHDGKIADAFGGHDIKGASLDFHATPQAFNAKGDVLINGVLAKLNWQHIQGTDGARQPPMRLTARLDASDRKQLGIDVGRLVQGEVPVEFSVTNPGQPDQSAHVRADLTPAHLSISDIGWEKPAGRQAFMDFDVAGNDAKTSKVLENFQITGSDIAIEGKVQLDSDGRAVAFDFPRFSLNLVSRLTASGERTKGNVWRARIAGKTFGGQKFFQSLFSVGGEDGSGGGSQETLAGDFDISVKIDNVLGFQDISLRGLDMTIANRGGKLAKLKGRGVLDGGKPLAFELRGGGSKARRLLIDTSDAGTAFKLIGFYPNMVNGRLRLEIDLEGRGAAEKTGTLWVENFKVLGDPVISEVVGSPDESMPAIAQHHKVVRQEFEFDSLRAPFSVGHGQIVIEDASLHGALLGATLRGKADFNNKSLDLGGTYVLLQGLNNMFAPIPVFGELLSGPRKEGIFGTNYAIRGNMERPQVFVHPLSALAPGIFREIFQLAPEAQQVSPNNSLSYGAGMRVRSSSSPATVGDTRGEGRTIDGWHSNTQKN